MKKKVYLLVGCLIALSSLKIFSQQEEPITVSPLIGEELDRVERNYFHLFPRVDGFEKAVFYLNDDNSLKVEMKISSKGVIKDTVIPKYSSLEEIEKHIINSVFIDLRDNSGPNFTVRTSFSRLTAQKMVTLNEQKLFTVDKLTVDQISRKPSLSSIWETDLNDIHSVIKEGESNIWSYAQTGTLIGSGVGLLIGFLVGQSDKSKSGIVSSEAVGVLGGVLIGAAVGLVIGTIVGISTSQEEVIIYPHMPEGISTLQSYSLYHRNIEKKNE
jgi:hypothetical protein